MPQLGIFVMYFNLLGLLLGFLRDIHLLWNVKDTHGEFPGDLVVRIWCFHCRGMSSVPGWGTQPGQNTNNHTHEDSVTKGERRGSNKIKSSGLTYTPYYI